MRTTDLDGHGAYTALKARDYKGPSSDGDGDGAPLVVAHTLSADGFDASEDGTGRGIPLVADPISAHEQSTYTHEGKGNFRLRNVIPFDTTQIPHPVNRSRCEPGDPSGSLSKEGHAPAVAFRSAETGANGIGAAEELAYTLDGASQGIASSGVRRLTPVECERLQGFPDSWTGIPGMADGPRYKCLGNAVTVSVAGWIGRRIAVAICGATGWR